MSLVRVRHVVVAVCCVLAAACGDGSSSSGGSTEPSGASDEYDDGSDGALGAPGEDEPTADAKGGPLDVDVTEQRGCCRIDDQPNQIVDRLRDACGGELCVKIRTDVDRGLDQTADACTILVIDHPRPLHRGDTVTFMINRPCGEDAPTTSDDEAPTSDDESVPPTPTE